MLRTDETQIFGRLEGRDFDLHKAQIPPFASAITQGTMEPFSRWTSVSSSFTSTRTKEPFISKPDPSTHSDRSIADRATSTVVK